MARRCISIMMHNGRIRTESHGQELLPKEGGYVMYSNHQGKYDTLGIMYAHPKPCTIVMDAFRSKLPIADSFIELVQGSRLDKRDMKSQMKTILKIAEEVKGGRRYIIFPEGGYDHNTLCTCMKCHKPHYCMQLLMLIKTTEEKNQLTRYHKA